MSFNPYLFFSGNCAEAFNRYHEIFGGCIDRFGVSWLVDTEPAA